MNNHPHPPTQPSKLILHLSLFLALLLLSPTLLTAQPTPTKTITHQNTLTFQIPTTWKEVLEKDGTASYYADEPDSGTLRLNILTFKSPPDKLAKNGYEQLLKDSGSANTPVSQLDNGNGMRRREKLFTEDGEKLVLYSWDISNVVPPSHYRMAIFTWTILESQSKLPTFKEEIEQIESRLKKVTFSQTLANSESN